MTLYNQINGNNYRSHREKDMKKELMEILKKSGCLAVWSLPHIIYIPNDTLWGMWSVSCWSPYFPGSFLGT